MIFFYNDYNIYPKYSERLVLASSADTEQTASDQGLHCLLFSSAFFSTLVGIKMDLFKIWDSLELRQPS